MDTRHEDIIRRTAEYVEEILNQDATGHDWQHVKRVWLNAKRIGKSLKADMFIVEMAALLHDVADWKLHGGDISIGTKKIEEWLRKLNVNVENITHITSIIEKASFKGAKVKNEVDTLEGQIVQDADRLDAIGAIGIARAFAYGGAKGREIYNPDKKPILHTSAESYSKNTSPTINHFYEKLLLIKDLINTEEGKLLARSRHQYMEDFLRQFDSEVTEYAPSEFTAQPTIETIASDQLQYILIDDDIIVQSTWELMAKRANKSFRGFTDPADFFKIINKIPQTAFIYIDSNLEDGIKGEDIAKQLYEQGFPNLYIASGYDKEQFLHLTFLKGIQGKDPPF